MGLTLAFNANGLADLSVLFCAAAVSALVLSALILWSFFRAAYSNPGHITADWKQWVGQRLGTQGGARLGGAAGSLLLQQHPA